MVGVTLVCFLAGWGTFDGSSVALGSIERSVLACCTGNILVSCRRILVGSGILAEGGSHH